MDMALNPFPWFRIMRESAPVYFEQRNNMWNVFRYDDVQTVLTDYTNFSSQFIGSNQPIDASLSHRSSTAQAIALISIAGFHSAYN